MEITFRTSKIFFLKKDIYLGVLKDKFTINFILQIVIELIYDSGIGPQSRTKIPPDAHSTALEGILMALGK